MRNAKGVASGLGALVVGTSVLATLGAVTYVVVAPGAVPSGRLVPGGFVNITSADLSSAADPVTDAAALSSAVHSPAVRQAVTWADDKTEAAGEWAQPRVQGVTRLAGRYEPHFDMAVVRKGYGDEAQLQVSLGRAETRQLSAAHSQVNRLGFLNGNTPVAARKKGHWFLFAAGGSNAIGVNLLRDPSGELRRAGWSSEHIAAVGSGQVGIGWRKGPLQASFGMVQRELSTFGHSANERFMAFTISLSGGDGGAHHSSGGRSWVERDDGYNAHHR